MCFLVFRFTVQGNDVASLEELLWFRSSPSKEFNEQRREFTSLSDFHLTGAVSMAASDQVLG